MSAFEQRPDIDARPALRRLAVRDSDLARAWALVGDLPGRRRQPGFATLLRVIVEQQLSTAAADAIWARLAALVELMTAQNFLGLTPSRLERAGLSRPKIFYCQELARAVAAGRLDLAELGALDDDVARERLLAIKGIGRWTADIYLLFALGRRDIWPAVDVALRTAVQRLKRLDRRPTAAEMDCLAEPWRPDRGVAARLLWRYYRLTRTNGG
jgi:DNA-3-methyladenine glycosylase II